MFRARTNHFNCWATGVCKLPIPPPSPTDDRRQTTRLQASLSLHICITSCFLRPKTSPKRWSISNLSTQLSLWTEYLGWILAAKTEVGPTLRKTPSHCHSVHHKTRVDQDYPELYLKRFSSHRAVNTHVSVTETHQLMLFRELLHILSWQNVGLLNINLLNPTGYVMHQQFNIQQLYVLPTLYLCVLYLSENKQRIVPLTA